MAEEKAKHTIIRDTREKDGCGWKFRASANCQGMEVYKLDTGDYSVKGYEHLIMVERKSIGDLWGTLTSGKERFVNEMERARTIPARYLIIEGTVGDVDKGYKYSQVSSEYIHGYLISLQVKYGIHVIFAGRQDQAQTYARRLLLKLARYCDEGVIRGTKPDNTA